MAPQNKLAKIAFINQAWDSVEPPVSAESIPIWTYEIAKRLATACKVVIYSRHDKGQCAVQRYEDVEYRRLSVGEAKLCNGTARLHAKIFKSFRYLNSRLYYLPYALRVASDLHQQQCDIVHIHNFSQFVPIVRAFNPDIKIVLHMHCEWVTQFKPEIVGPRLAQADLIIGCSDYITGKIKTQFPEVADRCQTVYNGVDTDQFAATQATDKQNALQNALLATQTTDNLARNLLFVGRVSPEKGLHVLVEAFCEIATQFPTAQLFIVGSQKQIASEFIVDLSDDPLVQNLSIYDSINYLASLKAQLPPEISNRVIFTGQISHLLLHDYFQRADVLINPSVSEAFGMSLVEAMATGTPTIGTDVGGMPEIIQQGETGFVVPPENPAAMAKAIAQILSDESLRERMSKASRKRAVDIFSWQAITRSLQNNYEQLLAVDKPSVSSQNKEVLASSAVTSPQQTEESAVAQFLSVQKTEDSGL